MIHNKNQNFTLSIPALPDWVAAYHTQQANTHHHGHLADYFTHLLQNQALAAQHHLAHHLRLLHENMANRTTANNATPTNPIQDERDDREFRLFGF